MTKIDVFKVATQFGEAFTGKSADTLKRAKLARTLVESEDMTVKLAAEMVKVAIAAAQLGKPSDDADVLALAETVKVSAPAISQYVSAINRAETVMAAAKSPTAELVDALYRTATTSGVKAAQVNDIVDFSATLGGEPEGRIEHAVSALRELRVDVAQAKRDQRIDAGKGKPKKAEGEPGDVDDMRETAAKSGSLSEFSFQDILDVALVMADSLDKAKAKASLSSAAALKSKLDRIIDGLKP